MTAPRARDWHCSRWQRSYSPGRLDTTVNTYIVVDWHYDWPEGDDVIRCWSLYIVIGGAIVPIVERYGAGHDPSDGLCYCNYSHLYPFMTLGQPVRLIYITQYRWLLGYPLLIIYLLIVMLLLTPSRLILTLQLLTPVPHLLWFRYGWQLLAALLARNTTVDVVMPSWAGTLDPADLVLLPVLIVDSLPSYSNPGGPWPPYYWAFVVTKFHYGPHWPQTLIWIITDYWHCCYYYYYCYYCITITYGCTDLCVTLSPSDPVLLLLFVVTCWLC